jgi:hypothetical protein
MRLRRSLWISLLALAVCPAIGQVKLCGSGSVLDTPEAAAAAAADTSGAANSLRGVDRCPTLPRRSRFTWAYHEGPDFGVCYGSLPGAKRSSFGVYLGNFPSFIPKEGIAIEKGVVGGHDVTWYEQDPNDRPSKLYRQTLIIFCHDPNYTDAAHIWVSAENRTELATSLSDLGRMLFKH